MINIKEILNNHKLWLQDSTQGQKANLLGAKLRGADLRGANLRGADLLGANLLGANLLGADLSGANLSGANLHCANLHCADLRGANLHCANLHCANLHCADLRGANLRGANLRGADLYGANLRGADLYENYKSDGDYHHITNIGSENGTLELYSCGDKGWLIKRGCFTGSKEEFISKVKETHGDNEHAVKYLTLVDLLCKEK